MSAADFPPLRELQLLLWKLITAPEGVAAGIDALRRRGELASPELDFLVRGDARLDARSRLDVYADMYFYRLRDCLAEDYPKLLERIGPERFHNLVTDYLLAHPSKHPSLRELGRALPAFVAQQALASDFAEVADLARLEWARVDVFDESDAETLSRDSLLERAGADPGFRLALGPATRRLRLRGAALARWREPDVTVANAATDDDGEVEALVWRRDFGVYHRSLPDDEAACLDALAETPLGLPELGERLVAALPEDAGSEAASPEVAGVRLAALLETWTRDALLIAG